MISVVMPYWKRQDALLKNLDQYAKLYPTLDLEIIIVDDGSPEPARIGSYPFPVKVIRLPDKDYALNPCVGFNRGVAESSGNILVLTNPEVIHRTAILGVMRDELYRIGLLGYISAACWNGNVWYCHSKLMPSDEKMGRAKSPKGAGLHFCSMLHRSLYELIGGFDEAYRNGQGYEDNDFLWKLHGVGTHFRILDDCVTDHIATSPSKWRGGSNKEIFERKWLTRQD